ncbi:helix-turn-helix domain-containing protein [Rhizorhabdus sp.]|uniref:LexA family protein n=1 Tax=Rhizorhabdus sp. TaxID=1968843 RepID=UPI0019B002CE|nr:helix-turn-helix domain-containing protein [Rhizorhabdus sp.]MBD3762616.1 hypothetical protein [Rhizorhabdus sp.]
MTQGLTDQQFALLTFLRQQVTTPSYREMQVALGLASSSGVHRLVTALIERGFVETIPGRKRCLRVVQPPVTREAIAAWLASVPSHILHAELERRDRDPAWNGEATGPAVCPCGHRAGTREARECETNICPLRGDNREAA